ncbi:MAG: phosphoribosylglycinamide formyltransferase, partial [Spirochaetaceae bacterium]|nr:phosphoribosylglycinamide formyltransferase [Spirochaetaceae bacterium]
MHKKKVAVLVSGGGTNLQALIDAERRGELPHAELALVAASDPSAGALERAKAAGIPACVVNAAHFTRQDFFDKAAYSAALFEKLAEVQIDVVVLAGFLVIVDEPVLSAYSGRILNVHPSLIPAFCGDGFFGLFVHEAALACGVKITGATVHLVNSITDGGRILRQKA